MRPPDVDPFAADLLEQQDFLRRAAREIVGEQEADDAAQDAWVAALSPRRGRPRALRAWLFAVLRHHGANRLEREARRAARERLAARDEALAGADEVEERLEHVRRIAAAVRALPEPYRRAIYLRTYEDRGPTAIARELGVPIETVHSRLRRGRALLRERLDHEYGGREAWALALGSMFDALPRPRLVTPPEGCLPVPLGIGGLMSTKLAMFAGAALVAVVLSIWQPWRTSDASAPVLTAQGTSATLSPAASVAAAEPVTNAGERSERLVDPTRASIASPVGLYVCDRAGEPIEGASIRTTEVPPREGVTDASGRWRLPLDEEHACWCTVSSAGYAGAYVFHRTGEETRVELYAAVSLRGRVLDAESRAPISGAEVVSFVQRVESPPKAITDEFGRFELRGVPESAKVQLSAEAERYPTANSNWDLRDLPDGAEVELLLRRALPLEVRLVAAGSGEPLPGLEVQYRETDEDGRVSLEVIPDAESRRVGLQIEGEEFYPLQCSFDQDPPARLELALPLPGRFEGFVLDGAGRPVPGARIEFQPVEGNGPLAMDLPHGHATSERWDGLSCGSDETGHYLSPPLFPEEAPYDVVVRHDRYPMLSRVLGAAPAGVRERRDLVFAGLEPAPVGSVRGRVLLNGEPADARVFWKAGEAVGAMPVAPSDGAFLGKEVPAGKVALWIQWEDSHFTRAERFLEGTRVEVDVLEGEVTRHDFDVELPIARIGGRVLTANGGAPPELLLRISDTEGRFHQPTYTESDGSWQDWVPGFDWEYAVVLDEGGATRRVPGLRAGDLDVEIVLADETPFARLPLRAIDAETGRAIQEWELAYRAGVDETYRPGRRIASSGFASRPGAIFPIDLPPGELDLFVSSRAAGYRSRTVRGARVQAGANPLLEVRLERGLELVLVLAEDVELPGEAGARLLLLEDELFETVHYGDEILPGEPSVRFGSDALRFGYGPFYSSRSLSSRFVQFGADRRARMGGLAPGLWRFRGIPNGVVVEPEVVRLPAAGPVRIRWHPER